MAYPTLKRLIDRRIIPCNPSFNIAGVEYTVNGGTVRTV